MIIQEFFSAVIYMNGVMALGICYLVAFKGDDFTAVVASSVGLLLFYLMFSTSYSQASHPLLAVFGVLLVCAIWIFRLLLCFWKIYVFYFTERGRQIRQREQKIAQAREAIAARGGYTDPARNRNPHDEKPRPS